MIIKSVDGISPSFGSGCRGAETASVLGDARIGDNVSIWPGAVIRADETYISIGSNSNIQDNCVIHCDPGYPAVIGESCLIGHGAILHGCTLEKGCLIGMGAVLLDGCIIGEGSYIAAGALITQHTVIPPGSMVMGVPGKIKRGVSPEDRNQIISDCARYTGLAEKQLPEINPGS